MEPTFDDLGNALRAIDLLKHMWQWARHPMTRATQEENFAVATLIENRLRRKLEFSRNAGMGDVYYPPSAPELVSTDVKCETAVSDLVNEVEKRAAAPVTAAAPTAPTPRRKPLSPKGRAAIARAARKRWAAYRKSRAGKVAKARTRGARGKG